MPALNDATINAPPTLSNRISLWALKLASYIGASVLIAAVAASAIIAAIVAVAFFIILSPVILFGMERT